MSSANTTKAREVYSGIDPYEGLSYSRRPSSVSVAMSLFSEFALDALKRSYRVFEHHEGFGLHVSEPEAVPKIPDFLAARAKMISIHSKYGAVTFDAHDLERFHSLLDIRFGNLVSLKNIASLPRIESIKRLAVETIVKERMPFASMESLEELCLNGGSDLSEIESLSRSLKSVTVDNLKSSKDIAGLQSLRYLKIVGANSEKDLGAVSDLGKLKVLILNGVGELQATEGIENAAQITHLVVENCNKLESIVGLDQLPNLCFLEMRKCRKLKNIEFLKQATSLTDLYVFSCPLVPKQALMSVVDELAVKRYFYM